MGQASREEDFRQLRQVEGARLVRQVPPGVAEELLGLPSHRAVEVARVILDISILPMTTKIAGNTFPLQKRPMKVPGDPNDAESYR